MRPKPAGDKEQVPDREQFIKRAKWESKALGRHLPQRTVDTDLDGHFAITRYTCERWEARNARSAPMQRRGGRPRHQPRTKTSESHVVGGPVEEMMKVGRHFVGAALPFSSVTRILLVILMRKQISARLQENETCSSRKAECSSQASSSAARPVSRPLGIFLYALLSRRPCRLLASLSVDSAVRVRVIISRCGNSSHWSQIVSERRDCPALFQSCAKESRATPTIICAPLIHDAYRSHARTFRAPVCAVARPGDSSEGC